VGAIILLGRMYLKSPEETVSSRFPIQSPASKEIKPPEAKPDLAAQSRPQPEAEKKPFAGIPEPSSPAIAEKKPPAPPSGGETKSPLPPPLTEIRPAPGKPEPPPVPGEPKPTAKPELKLAVTKPIPMQPSRPGAKEEAAAKKTVLVKGKDSLYSISLRNYGVANTSIVDQILEANPKIGNPNKLSDRLSIRLPEVREESLLIPLADGTYQVRLGTFLKAEYAAFLKGEPSLRGKTVEVIPRKLPSGETWYRAVAGQFNTREEGLKVIQELKRKGLSPYFPGFRKKK
jgi:phage tail protein X